jgi:prevent-host-death family protein
MKTVTIRDLQKSLKECVEAAQEDRVIVTRRGKPAVVLIGISDKDWETVVLQTDPRFWRMVRSRRNQETLSLAEMRERVGVASKRR